MPSLLDFITAQQGQPNILGALQDEEFRKRVKQGLLDAANRGVVAGTLGGPVDLATLPINAARGLMGKAPIEKPVGGSEWLGGLMEKAGMVSPERNAPAELLAGLALPWAMVKGAAKVGPKVEQAVGKAAQTAVKELGPTIANRAENYMFKTGGALPVYLPHTPGKPNPLVGTRYETEDLGGLIEKFPLDLEGAQRRGDVMSVVPWDNSNRNTNVKAISDVLLPEPVKTHGGIKYTRDVQHAQEGVAGASNSGIASRIKTRDANARQVSLDAGGSGNVIHMPITMDPDTSMNFSVQPSDAYLALIKASNPSKKAIKNLDELIRTARPEGKLLTQDFAGINTPEGLRQIEQNPNYRKALAFRMSQATQQKNFGFNNEDLVAALADPDLRGVQKGMGGMSSIVVGPEGMKLSPSSNRTYDTNFSGTYGGTLGYNIPVEVLMPDVFERISQELAGKPGNLRNMVIGAMETRNKGVYQPVNQRTVDSISKYIENQRKLGLMGSF